MDKNAMFRFRTAKYGPFSLPMASAIIKPALLPSIQVEDGLH